MVMTNKSLTGPNRGYACGHLYFETERMMDLLADAARARPRRGAAAQPDSRASAFPYRTPTGGLYDSGDYAAALDTALEVGRSTTSCGASKRGPAPRAAASASGWRWPSIRPCRTWATWRRRSTPSSAPSPSTCRSPGAVEAATVKVDPARAASPPCSAPRRRARATRPSWPRSSPTSWASTPRDITVVDEMDTFTRLWSISSGTYSSRFGSVGTSAVALAARKLKAKLVEYAAHLMERPAEQRRVPRRCGAPHDGRRGRRTRIKDLAGRAHWNTESLPDGMEPGLPATAVFGFTVAKAVDARGPGQLVEHLRLHRRGHGGGGRSRHRGRSRSSST